MYQEGPPGTPAATSLNVIFQDKGLRTAIRKGCSGTAQQHWPLWQVLSDSSLRGWEGCPQGTQTVPPLHSLWFYSAREALIKEGPQQVFEDLFLPTVL